MVVIISMVAEDFIRWRRDLITEGLITPETNSEDIFKGALEIAMFAGRCDITVK